MAMMTVTLRPHDVTHARREGRGRVDEGSGERVRVIKKRIFLLRISRINTMLWIAFAGQPGASGVF
jgi:hypothetical protein